MNLSVFSYKYFRHFQLFVGIVIIEKLELAQMRDRFWRGVIILRRHLKQRFVT